MIRIMKWSKNKPQDIGFYWHKDKEGNKEILFVQKREAFFWGTEDIVNIRSYLKNSEWYGPLNCPKG